MKKTILVLFIGIAFLHAGSASADADPTVPAASAVATTTPHATPITFLLSGVSNDASAGGTLVFATSSDPSNGTLGAIGSGGSVTYTPESAFTGTDSFSFIVTEGATSSVAASVTITVSAPPVPDTAQIKIRDSATLIGPVTVELPDVSADPVAITPSAGGGSHTVPARSVLSVLATLDTATSTFDVSDLQYFSSFSSFLINCITIPADPSSSLCGQWQYVVNGFGPAVGIDQTTLEDGDVAILYFGFPRQVSLSASNVTMGQSFTATAQIYDPTDNTSSPATGVTIGVTQPNPDDPFTPLEIATSTVDASGQAVFTLNATGTYQVGLQEDFYFPTTNITVTDAAPSPSPAPSGGGGGGISHGQFNVSNALSFLSAKQSADGSFNSSLITDWAAIAFGAADPGAAKTKLKNYLLTASPALTSVPDYERHAMALEALGIDPYSGTATNYIAPIVAAFNGTQIMSDPSNPAQDNDDIFAIFALLHAGYAPTDPMIQKVIAFIVAAQKPDGSWDSNPDMTAAAMQAVGPFFTAPGYGTAMGKAVGYLRSTQLGNGGWGTGNSANIDSTSWVQTAINAVQNSDPSHAGSWASSVGYLPTDVLASAQQSDGAVQSISASVDTRVWSTSYAVVAAAAKDWMTLLGSFSQPSGSPSGGGGNGTPALQVATSTIAVATSTLASATTTPAISPSTTPFATTTVTIDGTAIPNVGTTSIPVPPKKKPVTLRPTIPATSTPTATPDASQTAAAGAGLPVQTGGGFLSQVWHSIVSFFSGLF